MNLYNKEWYLNKVEQLTFEELKEAIQDTLMEDNTSNTFKEFITQYEKTKDTTILEILKERFAGYLCLHQHY